MIAENIVGPLYATIQASLRREKDSCVVEAENCPTTRVKQSKGILISRPPCRKSNYVAQRHG